MDQIVDDNMGSLPHLSIVKGPTRSLKPNLLHRIFESVAQNDSADNVALLYEDVDGLRTHSYSQLDKMSNKMARCIRQNVINNRLQPNADGDYIVAVSMYPSDKLVIALLAIWKAGAAYLPIDPTFPGPRIEHIVRESKPFMVVYDEDSEYFLDTSKTSYEDMLTKSSEFADSALNDGECLKHQKDDLAIVLYTSGSTGVPKGVRLPHKVILNRLNWQFKTFPYSDTEKIGVFKTALTFVDHISEIWGPLINGLSVLVVPKSTTKDPEKMVAVLDKYEIERLVLVPSLLRSILMYLELQKRKSALSHLKIWVCSGETLATSLAEEFFKHFPENSHILCNFYGSTEIMGDVTFHVISNPEAIKSFEKVPIGVPVDNTIVYLLDNEFRPVKNGDVGELFISGLNLAAGYVNGRDPEKFVENPLAIDPTYSKLFRTGDFGRVEKGVIIYEGRTDSQVKIRGHRVDLAEVEKAVNSIEGVDKGVVLCYKPGEMNQALLAFVTTNALMSENQIENILGGKLTAYMVPQVVLMETIPLLVNGKTDRQALLKFYENTNNNDDVCYQVDIDYRGVPEHQMKAAKVLFETVATVLNRGARAAITINANFYEIGGNSLNSIFTITNLNNKGYHISISDFIAAMDFGEILDRMTSGKQECPTITAQPPTFNAELLKHEHIDDVIDMISTSFYQKADLERYLMPDIKEADYEELLRAIWDPLVEKGLSFVTKTDSDKIIGCALNFDARDEPEVEIHSKLTVIFEFLEFVEGAVRDNQLPEGKNKILHSFMMATRSSLTPKENVAVMSFMEQEVLKLGKRRKFEGVFTTNTSPLTQQLGSDVYGYQTMLQYQINKFVASDNTKPFGLAPDDECVKVQWKRIV